MDFILCLPNLCLLSNYIYSQNP